VLDKRTPYARVEAVVRNAAGEDLQDVLLFDVYEGKGVPEGQRSLAIRLTFGRMDRTLTDVEVAKPVEAAVAALGKELGAVLRG
jgi:phenylalanyl-tRNA synthetase beta chain